MTRRDNAESVQPHNWDSNGVVCVLCGDCSDPFHCPPRPCPELNDGSGAGESMGE